MREWMKESLLLFVVYRRSLMFIKNSGAMINRANHLFDRILRILVIR